VNELKTFDSYLGATIRHPITVKPLNSNDAANNELKSLPLAM